MEQEKFETKPVDEETETKLVIEVTEEALTFDGVASTSDLMNVAEYCLKSIPIKIRELAVLKLMKEILKDIESEAK